ncbi:DUF4157 domain-containing protein [Hymenobacter sp. BT175]|uniref:eCIS core domain-containing protein n=1 Tax=Hymenobacter translucens TaxID=2886507 RepID=UPI001D0DD239|nr:DUF4157 domain-containing protein [Hymenobacter translucens]MCC2546727.1 DUF4157 domain-containing protein [Hymenobacter translucens]
MATHANKAEANKSTEAASSAGTRQNAGSTMQFMDKRPTAVAQRNLQQSINNSPRSQQGGSGSFAPGNAAGTLAAGPAPVQKKENRTGLSDNLKAGMESLSGHSLDDVRVHYNSAKPAQLQAHAYAQGTDIHVAPGQEQHLPHEAWHVVQQKQGRVKPTMQLKGKVSVNDDAGLEKEADVMGARALGAVASIPGVGNQHAANGTRPFASHLPRGVVQRAVRVGTLIMPRAFPTDKINKLGLSQQEIDSLKQMHGQRDATYTFTDEAHLVDFLKGKSGVAAPHKETHTDTQLESGHESAEAIRHSMLFEPAPSQFGDHAPGAHSVPDGQLPPSGPSHTWAKTQNGNTQETTLWQTKHNPPTLPTQISTYGNPNNPSIFTSQGIFNMGMRVQPTTTNSDKNSRSSGFKSTLAGLQTETGRVRGHPLAVEQTQHATDPNDNSTFDDNPMLYTNESDGTKDSGFSTFRYSQIEKPAITSMTPFNQVNISSAPQVATPMGIPMTDEIRLLTRNTGTEEAFVFNNQSASGYGQVTNGKKRKHTVLRNHVKQPVNSFPSERPVKRMKKSPDPTNPSESQFEQRRTVAGWESPPPSPFLGSQPAITVKIPGRKLQNEAVVHQGNFYYVDTVDYDGSTDESTCTLKQSLFDRYQ